MHSSATVRHFDTFLIQLRIVYTNAHSLLNKLQELKVLINSLKHAPQIIAITEVNNKINSKSLISEYHIPGYELYSTNLEKVSRGILIYVDIVIWRDGHKLYRACCFGWAVRAHGVLWAELSARRCDCGRTGQGGGAIGSLVIYKQRADKNRDYYELSRSVSQEETRTAAH